MEGEQNLGTQEVRARAAVSLSSINLGMPMAFGKDEGFNKKISHLMSSPQTQDETI